MEIFEGSWSISTSSHGMEKSAQGSVNDREIANQPQTCSPNRAIIVPSVAKEHFEATFFAPRSRTTNAPTCLFKPFPFVTCASTFLSCLSFKTAERCLWKNPIPAAEMLLLQLKARSLKLEASNTFVHMSNAHCYFATIVGLYSTFRQLTLLEKDS